MAQLTQEERCRIYGLKESGISNRAIGLQMGRHHSVIGRELLRNGSDNMYDPLRAHRKARALRSAASKVCRRVTDEIKAVVFRMLTENQWSPQQISGRLSRQAEPHKISHERIYQLIWENKRKGGALYKHLRRRAKPYNRRGAGKCGRGVIPNRRDISERPEIVEAKQRAGDWEADTIIGCGHSGALLSLVDRYSKYTVLEKLPAKQAVPVREAVVARLKELKFPVHTITFDNGKEFARHEEISLQLNTQCFFAKPYHSWERGLNEHTNGLVRQYFPKYTNIAMLLPEEVKNVENLLNDRPRKILNFQTPNEVIQDATR